MDGLAFVRALRPQQPMPMAQHFSIAVVDANRGSITLRALPQASHLNPFCVVHGGFAATVLDMALGLVSVSVLEGDESSIATIDLSVRYIRAITPETGSVTATGLILHRGSTTIVAEARLGDLRGKILATGQCTNIIRHD
jgi:uncharacterized protein (TIGR00369 family)